MRGVGGRRFIRNLLYFMRFHGVLSFLASTTGHFRVALNLVMKARLYATFLLWKFTFHSYANKTHLGLRFFLCPLMVDSLHLPLFFLYKN